MANDDVLFGFRLRLFALAAEIGVRPACRAMGVHHSTPYRWKRRVDRWGLEALRVRERRRPRMPNELGPHLEQRILAFSLAHPGLGRSGSPPSWPGRSGAGSGSRPTESGACSAGTGSTPAPAAWASWPATPLATSGARPNPSPSGTSRPPGLASWSGSTASTSVASRAPRGRSGSTRRSTSDPASPGPSCTPHRAIHVPSTAARWWSGSPQSSPARAGGWRLSSPTTAPSFAPLTSARASGAWL
jgi:Winged helix-turn helix